ncbi:MAG: hypothetical protein KC502_02660 [Myxococcales bacterium]|nr:hypothetical protein [Myxococcales bacterium]
MSDPSGGATEIAAGDDLGHAMATAEDGATLVLMPGVHLAGLAVQRSVTLKAAGAGVIVRPGPDGGGVFRVDADGLRVHLHGISLTGGTDEVGGGLSVRGFSTVTLSDCRIFGCHGQQGPGDAIYADAGELKLIGCELLGDTEREAAVVAITGVAGLFMERCSIVGHGVEVLRLRDGCEAEISTCELRNRSERSAMSVAGTRTRAPIVKVSGCRLMGVPSLNLKAAYPGKVEVGDSVLASSALGVYRPMGGVVVRDA